MVGAAASEGGGWGLTGGLGAQSCRGVSPWDSMQGDSWVRFVFCSRDPAGLASFQDFLMALTQFRHTGPLIRFRGHGTQNVRLPSLRYIHGLSTKNPRDILEVTELQLVLNYYSAGVYE